MTSVRKAWKKVVIWDRYYQRLVKLLGVERAIGHRGDVRAWNRWVRAKRRSTGKATR